MDTRPADYIHHRMVRFLTAIDETREHFPKLSPFGRYPASAPYYERHGIMQILDSLDIGGEMYEELMQEFQSVEQRLGRLEKEQNKVYRCRLREELSARLDIYRAAVCHASLVSVNPDDHDLFRRDLIEILVAELEKDHDLTSEKHLIHTLDANLLPAGMSTSSSMPDCPMQAEGYELLVRDRDRIES